MARLDPYHLPLTGRHLIEASAGTGKTFNAVILWIRASLEWDLMPHQVLMVTFTRAATAELQQRLQQRIEALLITLDTPDQDPLAAYLLNRFSKDELIHRLSLRLQMLDDAAVTTLHGWAGQAVREFDRLLPFEVSDELPELKARAMERAWSELEIELGERALWLTKTLTRPDNAIKALDGLFNYKARVLAPAMTLDEAITAAQAQLGNCDLEGIESHKKPSVPNRTALRQGMLDGDLMAIAGVGDKEKFISPYSELIHACTQITGVIRRRLFERWEARLETTKSLQRKAEPDDQVRRLRQALTDPEFAQAVADRWPVALVDEFQDTDPDQLSILQAVYNERGALLMIGDPKQALYSFRGGDIAAYRHARSWVPEGNIHTIDQCFRMSKAMVEALNEAYARQSDPFSGQTEYHRIDAGRDEGELAEGGVPMAPIQFLEIAHNKQDALQKAANACAALLQAKVLKPDQSRLKPGDIAILVTSWSDGQSLRQYLADYGVGARVKAAHAKTGEGFLSFSRFASACAEPGNSRQALALVPYQISGIHSQHWADFSSEPELTLALMQRIQRSHELWLKKGPAAAARYFAYSGPDLDQLQGSEAGMATLAEFLDLAERIDAPHPQDAVRWARKPHRSKQHMPQPSDREAVIITTIHSAKGLEYPVVLVPTAPAGKKPKHNWSVHSDGQRTRIDLAPSQSVIATQLDQSTAESQRLLYVAVTRAKHLLILGGQKSCQLTQNWRHDDSVPFRLSARLAAKRHESGESPLPPGLITTALADPWRVHSFSGWIQGVDLPRAQRSDHDLEGTPGAYPKGPQAGDLLHRLLDWRLQGTLTAERAEPLLTALGVDDSQGVLAWIEAIVNAPILENQRSLSQAHCVPEMDFHFNLGRVNAEAVDRIIQADWPMPHRNALPPEQLQGLMKGSLDVTLEMDGRYWVLDYKSNFLGAESDYTEQAMLNQVAHHRYDLQAGIYLVALHRLLSLRLPDYDPARHLGGAIYHFVRVPTACVHWPISAQTIQDLDHALTGGI